MLAAALLLSAPARSQSFTDPEDGALDMSEFIIDYKGFLPVPMIITEPAVGYGGALGVGVRYLIARRLGIYMGADIARGPEQTAFYIQVGSAWR